MCSAVTTVTTVHKVVGRRSGSDAGGERAAAIYGLIGTAKLNGLNCSAVRSTATPTAPPARCQPAVRSVWVSCSVHRVDALCNGGGKDATLTQVTSQVLNEDGVFSHGSVLYRARHHCDGLLYVQVQVILHSGYL